MSSNTTACPVQQHATEWAFGVVASIDRDVRAGVSRNLLVEIRAVCVAEEWAAAEREVRGMACETARRQTWCRAFARALKQARRECMAVRHAALDRLLASYFASLDRRHAVIGTDGRKPRLNSMGEQMPLGVMHLNGSRRGLGGGLE